MGRIADGIRDGVRPGIPQATEWQHIGHKIDAAVIFTGVYFVNMH